VIKRIIFSKIGSSRIIHYSNLPETMVMNSDMSRTIFFEEMPYRLEIDHLQFYSTRVFFAFFLSCNSFYYLRVKVMVLNATFNIISAMSWRSQLECPEKTANLPQVTDKLYHTMLYRVHLVISRFLTHNVSFIIVLAVNRSKLLFLSQSCMCILHTL